ncbi:hypothetical protein BKA70DRAFT_1237480 [Coprinopsis sp. MPI-PUGE-AT-0042]|nr:hypothetical protein BKA70DRAFT_1237480 [Coprinopsis sp. MPI-PUGE-AT-0042]
MANVPALKHFANLSGKTQSNKPAMLVQHANTCPARNTSTSYEKCCKEGCKAVILNGSTPQLPFSPPLLSQPTRPGSFTWTTYDGRHSLSGSIGSDYSSSTLRSLSVRACVVFEHLSTSTVPKVLCPKCGLRFCEDLDPVISTDDQSIREIRSSIDEKQPDVTSVVAELAGRYQYSKLVFNLAHLQLRYALGVYLERSNHLNMEEAILHSTIHQSEGRLKSMSKNLNKTMKELVYQDVPGILAELPKDDFALLSAYQVDFTRIRSDSVFEDLADEANDRFDEVTRSELMNPICVFINLLGGFAASFTIPHHMFGRSTESDVSGSSQQGAAENKRRWSLNMCQAGTLR